MSNARVHSGTDGRLAAAIEILTARSLAGERITEQTLQEEFPELADQLVELLPTITTMLQWGKALPASVKNNGPPELQLHQPLGDFRIVRELGRGGMGVVYEAEQMSLGRRVAVKVLPFAALLDPRQLERFKNEVRAAAMLKHSNVVSVHAVACERGVHFYAMELIDGCSLADLINSVDYPSDAEAVMPDAANRGHPHTDLADTTPIAQLTTQYSTNRTAFYKSVARIGVEASQAIEFAHSKGILHRDIKPSNLLLDAQGVVHVADFGLALIENTSKMTLTGDIVGTLRYMSPQQLEAPSAADVRSDVYSLGATLYEALCGQPAMPGEHRAELLRSIGRDPTDLRKIDSAIPVDFATIVSKCLANSPYERYQSAAALADDLGRFIENRPIVARRTNPIESARRWIGRNRVVTGLTAITMTLLVSLAINYAARITSLAQEAKEQEIQLYGQAIRLAHESVRRGDFVSAESTLLNLVPATGEADHRGFEWSYLWNASHDPAIERTFVHSFTVYDTEFTDDDRLAVAWWAGRLPIWDLEIDAQLPPSAELPSKGVLRLQNIPGEDRLVTGNAAATLSEWDIVTGTQVTSERLELPQHESTVASIAINQNKTLVALGLGDSKQGHIAVWNRSDQAWIYSSDQFTSACLVEFGHDALLYVVERDSSSITVVDVQSGNTVGQFDAGISGVCHLSATPDRKQFVIVANPRHGEARNGMVSVWDLESKQLTATASLGSAPAIQATVAGDGSMIAVGDRSGMVYLLEGKRLDLIKARRAHFGVVNGLSFSPDGKRLATASSDNHARVWNVNRMLRDVSRVTLSEDLRYSLGAAFVDEETTVVSDHGGRLIFSNARSGKPTRTMQLPYADTNMHQLARSHGHRLIAVTHGRHPRSDQPTELYMVDAVTKSILWTTEIEPGIVYTVSSFSPDDRLLAVSAGDYVVIFDALSGEVVKRLHDGEAPGEHPYFKPATFSPDGRWLACGSTAGKLHIFSLPNYEKERVITVNAVCEDVQFSPDSQVMAVLDFDKRIKLYSPETGERIERNFASTPGFMSFVRFSPDGNRLLTGGLDGTVRIWHTQRGEQLLILDTPPGNFSVGGFSPSGNSIVVTGGMNAYVFSGSGIDLTPLDKAELEEIACSTQSGSVRRRLPRNARELK